MIIDFNNRGGGSGSGYTLPVATQSTLGGVKIGQGIDVDSAGTISVSGSDVANYAMALKSIQDGDENNYKVVNYGGCLYYIEDNKNEEENIFVKVMYDANFVNVEMDIDGQTDTDIMNIADSDFQFTISIDSEGKLFYVNENDENVYFNEDGVYQYGDFTFDWADGGKHIDFNQQSNRIEVAVYTDNYEVLYCVGRDMCIANEESLGLVKIGDGIEIAEDGTISVTGGGSEGEGIKIVHHLYEAEYQRVWLDQYDKATSATSLENNGLIKFYDISKYEGQETILEAIGTSDGNVEVTTDENNTIFVNGNEIPKRYESLMDVEASMTFGFYTIKAVRPNVEGDTLWFTVNGSANSKLYIYIDTDNKEVYDDDDEWTGGTYELSGRYDAETDTYDYDLEFESSSDVNGYTMAIQNYDHIVNEGIEVDGYLFLDSDNGFIMVNECGDERNLTLIDPIRYDIKDGQEVSVYEHFDEEYQFLRQSGSTSAMSYGQGISTTNFEYRNNKLITEDMLISYSEFYGVYMYYYATANDCYRFEYWNGAKPNGTQMSAITMTSAETEYTFDKIGNRNCTHTFTKVDDGLNLVFQYNINMYNQLYPTNIPAHTDVVQYTWTDDPELVCDISLGGKIGGDYNGGGEFFYVIDYHQFPYGKKLFVHQYYNATDPISFFEVDDSEMKINVYSGSTTSAHSETPYLVFGQGNSGQTGKYTNIEYNWKGNEIKFFTKLGSSLNKIYDLNTDLTATGWVRTNIEANVYTGYTALNEYEVIDSRGNVIASNPIQKRNIKINPTSSYGSIGSFYGQSNSDIGPIFAPATTAATADQLCVSAEGWAAPTWKTMLSLLGIKSVWKGTEDEYEAIGAGNYDSDVLYIIVEE